MLVSERGIWLVGVSGIVNLEWVECLGAWVVKLEGSLLE